MVIQYKSKKSGTWQDYKGKDKLKYGVSHYNFRFLTKDKSRVLITGNYKTVLKRLRQIEFFKHLPKK
jgi:hypothetical protein